MEVTKMDQNSLDPNLPTVWECTNNPSSQGGKQTKQPNCKKLSGCRIIATRDQFLLEKYWNIVT